MRLGYTGGNCTYPDRADELYVYSCFVVGVLEIVDELSKVFDRVDVVVWRGRDQTDAPRRVPRLGDGRVHLEAPKLPTRPGVRTLRHLDLNVGGVDQVVAGDPEPAGGHLLDGAAPTRIVQPVNVFAALTGVGPAADVVHRDGHGFVGFGGDGTVTHCPGVESGDDRLDRLDLLDGCRWAKSLRELEEAAQCAALAGEAVDLVAVLPEDLFAAGTRRMLKQEYRFGGKEMQLAFAPKRIFAAHLEAAVDELRRIVGIRPAVTQTNFLGDDVEPDTAELAWRAG